MFNIEFIPLYMVLNYSINRIYTTALDYTFLYRDVYTLIKEIIVIVSEN